MPAQYTQALRREAFKEWIKYDGWVKTSLLSCSKKEAWAEQQRAKGQRDTYRKSKIPVEYMHMYKYACP